MKRSFIVYVDYADKFQSLSDEQFGKLMRLMIVYAASGEYEPTNDLVVNLAFDVAKADLDRDGEKYEQIIEKRREAGKKGGLAKANNRVANVANAKFAKQTLANVAVNVNDNVNDNDNVNVKKKNTKKKTVAESRIGKTQYADEVYLTVEEYEKLISKHGVDATKRMIEILDGYKCANGKTYLDDYKAINNWVVSRYEEEQRKNGFDKNHSTMADPNHKDSDDDWIAFFDRGW